MAGQIEGSRAVAKAVASCRPDLICGCQGTVPGSIMAALAGQTRRGALARYGIVDTDSEAAAIAAALRAAGSGARAYTAAASQGLLQASEAVFNAAGLGLPVVMTAVTQPDATGASSWDDHSDAMSQRDSGWVQLYAETIQEAADLHIQAFRIAEALSVPVMVCVNGSLLTGATGPAGIADQDRVDAFLPRRVPGAAGPVPLGRASDPEAFTEVRYLTHARQLRALGLIPAPGTVGAPPDPPARPDGVTHRLHPGRVRTGRLATLGDLHLGGAAAGRCHQRVRLLGPDRRHRHIHRDLAARRRRPAHRGCLQRAAEPAGALARAVLGERRELAPAGRSFDQRALPHRDATEAGLHRDRERPEPGQQLRDQAPGRPPGHGRRGNLAKSGWRFSLKASRPSWASSLM